MSDQAIIWGVWCVLFLVCGVVTMILVAYEAHQADLARDLTDQSSPEDEGTE